MKTSTSILAVFSIAAAGLIFNFLFFQNQAQGACSSGNQLSCSGSELTNLTIGDLSLGGPEGNINGINAAIGYNDLFLKGNSAETAPIYYAASEHRFYTGGTEKLRINSSGNVGIGTASPNRNLVIYQAANPTMQLVNSSTGAAAGDGVQLYANGNAAYLVNMEAGSMGFGTNASIRMTIASNGNVGIGDTTPAAALTVGNGDLFQVNSSGDLIKVKNVTYSWPAANGAGVLTNNGSGGLSWSAVSGGIGGSGTANYIPLFTSSGAIGNSSIWQSGTSLCLNCAGGNTTANGNLTVIGTIWSSSGFKFPDNSVQASAALSASTGAPYAPGNALLIESSSEVYLCAFYYDWSWHRVKEIKITRSGAVRVKFDLHYTAGGTPARARITKNGVAVGTERSTMSGSYVTYTEDIYGLAANDLIQLQALGAGGACPWLRNFGIYIYSDAIPSPEVTYSL